MNESQYAGLHPWIANRGSFRAPFSFSWRGGVENVLTAMEKSVLWTYFNKISNIKPLKSSVLLLFQRRSFPEGPMTQTQLRNPARTRLRGFFLPSEIIGD